MNSLESDIDVEISNLSPFDILGIEPTDDKRIIINAYREMVLLVHPDKAKQNGLNWSPEQCNEAFNQIKKAYKTLKKDYNFRDAPDYDLPYEIEAFSSQKMKDLDQFNNLFEQKKQKDITEGMGDPYSVGYSDFDRPLNLSEDEYIELNLGKLPNNNTPPKKTKTEIINFKENGLNNVNNHYEFGMSKIDDFSFDFGSKGSTLSGTDISQVHQNNEYWGISVSRDKKLVEKYNDESMDFDKRMRGLERERSIEFNYVDDSGVKDKKLKDALVMAQCATQRVQKQRDEYHCKLNIE